MIGEVAIDVQDPPGLFDDEDEEEESYMQQEEDQQLQQKQQQQQQLQDSSAASFVLFSSSASSSAADAAAAAAESFMFTPSPEAPKQQQDCQQQQQEQQQQQHEEEAIDRSAVLLQCGGCPCHLLVFEELEARGLIPDFDLLHLIVLAATRPIPAWQQQHHHHQHLLLQQQQQHSELLQPMTYSWGLDDPQEVKLNLSMLRFAFDCMQVNPKPQTLNHKP